MRALLDVNFLIALLDADHAFHQRAYEWFLSSGRHGWASCPLTQNGFVRIRSHPSYSAALSFSAADAIGQLNEWVINTDHEFWSDEISILDKDVFVPRKIHGPRQITDLYLLALAAKNDGILVTFDEGVTLSAVVRADAANVCVV